MGSIVLLIVFVLPILSILIGILGTRIFRNIWISPLVSLVLSLVFWFTLAEGNFSFLFWVVCYTVISIISSVITFIIIKKSP
ncbi:YbeF family protein [Bacillus safensis]|uniref:DUF2651 family protein n=1 Tax=Bacillus TaxID=1386 RepID=UPI000D02CA06|nr:MULTISPECIES: DUF2651 family protein [Bacillus]MBW4848896.1 YbeF family protein [Bacillaceae bacterium]TFV08726.1 DUF2651 domain-containing protein [Bacillus stratosphericus]MBW4853592.1 YbeF family protein [Bacillaceae bacterium]MBW4854916.1 YbeF family protein [Bacillaceae bacterium]MCM3140246.1 YbeF family protein [Bacillus safensis]